MNEIFMSSKLPVMSLVLSEAMKYEIGHAEMIYHNMEEGPSRLKRFHEQDTYTDILSALRLPFWHVSMASSASEGGNKFRQLSMISLYP